MEIDLKYLPNILKISPELCGFCSEDQTRSFFLTASCSLITSFSKKKKCHSWFRLDAMSKIYHDNTEKWNAVTGSQMSHVRRVKDQTLSDFLKQVKITLEEAIKALH